MPHRQNVNTKLPRSSSSISLNESPVTDEINYDSDISDDDHAIAEGDDDDDADEEEEEEELDEGFEVEVSTLTGNTFSVMIQPQDTVEVLKTRIAFQEGISPADQNLVLEQQGKLLDNSTSNSTVEELNIGRNSRLTLVTNVASGVPFKNAEDIGSVSFNGGNSKHLWTSSSSTTNDHTYRLAPTIKRNYNGSSNGSSNNLNLPPPQSTSLRLPKILANNNNINNSNSNNLLEDKDNRNSSNVNGYNVKSQKCLRKNSSLPERLDEREWMQSLFNKVVQKEDGTGGDKSFTTNAVFDDNDDAYANDIDSTTGGLDSTVTSGYPPVSTRYGRRKFVPTDEDGNILVVQGDDGVILIIQKNTGQLLEDSANENDYSIDLGVQNGRIPAMGRYTNDTNSSLGGVRTRSKGQNGAGSDSVHERIKENAVTLEKMRQVRGMMAQRNQQKTETPSEKNCELPNILNGSSSSNGIKRKETNNNLTVPGVKAGYRSANAQRRNAVTLTRSINSSKTSLNRLVAEIYLQSKRKGYSFQPGQPPYTEQQLLRYVQLKVAILLDEQKNSKTEPCSKCVLSSDWDFNETAPYLIPTVVMNRYKRLSNSKSLDVDSEGEMNDESKPPKMTLRRKSVVPNLSSTIRSINLNGETMGNGKRTQIPRLIPRNTTKAASTGPDRTAPSTTASLSRRSSSSIPTASGACPPIRNDSSSGKSTRGPSTNQYIFLNGEGDNQISWGRNGQTIYLGKRPSLKIHQRVYTTGTGKAMGYSSKRPSRPGSSSKNAPAPAKKGAVRCPVCKKKIGIACRYQCRCGLVFCSIHRYPESHDCTFDYKTEGRNKIRENNPVIVAPKIPEI